MSEITRYLEMKAGRNGVVIVGNQSSGKTSLLEMIIRRTNLFQKFDGAATKRPCRIVMINTNDEIPYGRVGGTFGKKTPDMDLLSRLIAEKNDGDFDENPFEVTLWGNDLPNLVVTDYPGHINSARYGEDPDTPDIIKKMSESAIQDPDTHKLLVMNATVDRVRLELHKVRKYQSKMNLVEEEARLIEHRDKLKSDRIMDAKKQMEARRNRRQRGMSL